MPEKVVVNKKLRIIEVESFGNVTKDDILDSFQKTEEIYRETGINKIMVDTTKEEELPNPFMLIEIFSKVLHVFITALVLNQSQAIAKEIHNIETICFNRGLELKCFYDRVKALEWLEDN